MMLVDVAISAADRTEYLATRLTHSLSAVYGHVVHQGAAVGVRRVAVWAAEGGVRGERATSNQGVHQPHLSSSSEDVWV